VKARKCNGIALDIVGRSDVGRVRTANEDEIVFDSEKGIAILADGMGGLAAGEVASRTAAAIVYDSLKQADAVDEGLLRTAFSAANRQVLALSRQPEADAMGTTLVVWLDVGYGQCFIAHVGDSRAYRLRDHQLSALTEDHSLVQQLIDEGVMSKTEARVSSRRNIITRAIGLESVVQVDLRSWVRGQGDVFMLCSDGLTDMLSEAEVQQLLASRLAGDGSGDLEAAADGLVAAANEAGGSDNISVLLIRPD
jgi:serine/threonine protein phosphatase PrpC